jgi:2'-5' RNA ligase
LNSRVQLTLFVPGSAAEEIEATRRLLDPVQFNLIPAHVTLCREDELEGAGYSSLEQRLCAGRAKPLTLTFGTPESFSTHGILLPCVSGEEGFQELRRLVLGAGLVRRQLPHITLAHPRNPKAFGNSLANAAALRAGIEVTFEAVCRIVQAGISPWRVVQRIELRTTEDGDA